MAKSARSGGEAGTVLWAVVAVVAIGIFVAWLSMTAEPSVPPDLGAGADTVEAGTGEEGTPVTAAAFEADPVGFRGQAIALTDVAVVQQMGPAIVWVELPSGAPYLVKLTDALVAQGAMPAAQARVTVYGRVLEKADSLLNAWERTGVLQNTGHRQQAEFGSTFIEATAIRPAR